jgi:hypothetical protein
MSLTILVYFATHKFDWNFCGSQLNFSHCCKPNAFFKVRIKLRPFRVYPNSETKDRKDLPAFFDLITSTHEKLEMSLR